MPSCLTEAALARDPYAKRPCRHCGQRFSPSARAVASLASDPSYAYESELDAARDIEICGRCAPLPPP